MFDPATPDEEWLTKLGPSGEKWVILSGDVRIGKNAHERAAWQQSGLTVFFFQKAWMHLPLLTQHAKLTQCLETIIKYAEKAKPGSGFTVSVNGKVTQIY